MNIITFTTKNDSIFVIISFLTDTVSVNLVVLYSAKSLTRSLVESEYIIVISKGDSD